jgi:hypothetical protein
MLNGVAPAQIVGNVTYLMGEHPILISTMKNRTNQ